MPNMYQEYLDAISLKGLSASGYYQGFYYDTTYNHGVAQDHDKYVNNINVMMYWLERRLGYSHKSACACIGNAMYESEMNPASLEVYQSTERGGGLYQWTPFQQYMYWPAEHGQAQYWMVCSGEGQMKRFKYEYDNNDTDVMWSPTYAENVCSWPEFRSNSKEIDGEIHEDYWTVEQLTEHFCRGYLFGGWTNQRVIYALQVYDNVNQEYHPLNPYAWLLFKMSKLNRGELW